MTKEIRDKFYTVRWYVQKIISQLKEGAALETAKELLLVVTKEIGESIAVAPAPAKPPVSGKVLKIATIVGHTKKASGAFSKTLNQSEYVYNTDLLERIQKLAPARGCEVLIVTRDTGGIKGAYAAALKWKPDVVLEAHFNAANGKASGAECLFSDNYDQAGLKELLLAQILAKKMADALGIPNRGAKERASSGERGFQNLSQTTNIASVLFESGFGDNPVDAKAMRDKKDALAAAILDGVLQWKAAL